MGTRIKFKIRSMEHLEGGLVAIHLNSVSAADISSAESVSNIYSAAMTMVTPDAAVSGRYKPGDYVYADLAPALTNVVPLPQTQEDRTENTASTK